MSTTAANFRRVGDIFHAAARLDPQAREAFLLEQSAGDEQLLDQLRKLFRADQLVEGVLDQPALGESVSLTAVESAVLLAGKLPERIGRYRIVRVIGEGGMGVVYEAEQDEPRRRVALKVNRPGTMSASLLRRFRHEAQMLGQLQHPGIAQIYDAGTADQGQGGQPYFAMELVHGRPLLESAHALRLGTRQRLDLMARICDAVHHAHLNGIIHRDLKPVNILVVDEPSQTQITGSQGVVQPKILDFGIARATESDIQTVTVRTDVRQLLGTVAYMSPEQAAGDPAQLDIRSDVYALGVIAYELISGRLPYDVQGKLIHEAVRVIREDDPSRLSSIARAFRGDVETIIAKALEKEKDRRYQSAAEFAADIRRYLSEQPIAARPASRLYQMRKFARRNKAIVAGVAVAFAALTIGTVVSLRQAILAERARSQEQRLRGIADERTAEAERQSYRASLVAASSALRFHETPEASRHLNAAPEHLRGWEWSHLHSRLDDSVARFDVDFTPMGMAISPDGRTFASGNSGGGVHTWRFPEMTPVASHKIAGGFHERRIARLVFSADGRELRVDAAHGSSRLDANTFELIARDHVPARARSADGRLGVVIDGQDTDRISIIEFDGNRELFQFGCRDAFNSVMEFTPDGKHVAICLRDEDGLSMRRTADGALVWRRADLNQLTRISFSSDGSRAATASMNGAAQVIDARTGEDLVLLKGHAVSVSAIAFNHDETLIGTASGDRTVRLWRAADGLPVAVMRGDERNVVDMAFTTDGSMLVTASADGMFRWWNATIASDPFVLPTSGTVYGLAFTPNGDRIVAASLAGDRPLRIWDARIGKEVFAGGDGNLSALAVDDEGTKIAVGRSGSAPSTIYDQIGSEVAAVGGHWWRTNWLAFRNNGQELLSLGNGGRLLVHDLVTGKQILRRNFPAESTGEGCRAAINPDRSLIAVASHKTIHLLDFATLDVIGTIDGKAGNIYALAFSPDGARLATGSSDGMLRVWNVKSQELISTLTGHSAEIYAVLFSTDGNRIFSGGRDRVIRVWDAHRYEEITQMHGHTSLIYCLALSADGRTLASGGGDATVRLWGTRPYGEAIAPTPSP